MKSEYAANLYLQTVHRARQVSTTRMPTYPPLVRFRFLIALSMACFLYIVK